MQRRHLKNLTFKSFPFYKITLDENILDSDHYNLTSHLQFANSDYSCFRGECSQISGQSPGGKTRGYPPTKRRSADAVDKKNKAKHLLY